ncbi:response regulator transcription factor [Caproicibacter fermentans]|uniref:response regulator transcription factor n=1 Tax=Caproicibacter fermentans TaxID=2576756 RepID=UPI0038B363C1
MNKKILLVDDEKGIVAMMKSCFEMSDYKVYTAFSGKEALQKVVCKPDIILLDINMPEMDGLSVCQRIREHLSCPILFLTARIETSDKIKGFGVGGDDYIVKPFDLDELGARVTAHLRRENRKQGQSELRFFDDMTIDYSKREIEIARVQVPFPRKNLILWNCSPQMPVKCLIMNGFMTRYGA